MEMTTAFGRRAGQTLIIVALTTMLWASRLLGLAIYVLSLIAAWNFSGWGAAALTAVTPPIGQMFWFYWAWATSGSLFTPYGLTCFAWAGLMLIRGDAN
jgi:hypothetical protein